MGEHPMAMNAFLLIDCFGLIFLMYALANFWSEWRRHKNRSREVPLDGKIVRDRIAVNPRVFLYPKNVAPVIPFPERYGQISPAPEHHKAAATTIEMRAIRKHN